MSQPYEETFDGVITPRRAPGTRHELICARLHAIVDACLTGIPSTHRLPPRDEVRVSQTTTLRPDLALVVKATGKLWLAVEIISSDDHRTDTVIKKQIYEDIRIPRLWMVDPRYDNLEVYHCGSYGLALTAILAGREQLTESLLPELSVVVAELFAAGTAN